LSSPATTRATWCIARNSCWQEHLLASAPTRYTTSKEQAGWCLSPHNTAQEQTSRREHNSDNSKKQAAIKAAFGSAAFAICANDAFSGQPHLGVRVCSGRRTSISARSSTTSTRRRYPRTSGSSRQHRRKITDGWWKRNTPHRERTAGRVIASEWFEP